MKTPGTLPLAAGAALLLGAAAVNSYADYAAEVLGQKPLAYWRFSEQVAQPTANVATNLGSLREMGNGTYYDVFRPVDGAVAGDAAVAFSNPTLGTGSFGSMRVENAPSLNPSGPFSIEFWAKPSNKTASLLSPVNSMSFVTGRTGYLFYQNGAAWQFWVGDSSSTTASVLEGGVITPNQWQHVVGVFTPTTAPQGTMTLFVDGVQVATGTGSYEPNTDAAFFVGSTSSPNRSFDGAVDEVAFFDKVLSASKIAAHFAARTTNAAGYATQILADAPVGYWRLNEPAAFPTAMNQGTVGTAANGKYLGATTVEGPAGGSFPGFQANNSAVAFDGTISSYVLADTLGLSGPLTMIAWIKPNVVEGDKAIAGEYASAFFKLSGSELRFTTPGILDHTSSGAGVEAGVWQQVAVTVVPGTAGGVQFYRNDQVIGAVDASAMNKGAMAFWIGKNQWADQYFDGAIDEVAVFDKALSAGSIMSLYFTAVGSSKTPFMVSDPPTVSPAGTIYSTTAFSLSADAAGALPLSYQWRRGGANLPGATNSTYTVPSASVNDAGTYDVVVRNAFGSVTSAGVIVAIQPATPPSFDQQPAARLVYPGGRASFTVAVSGTPPISYQWKHAGSDVPGATNATLVVANCTSAEAGAYSVGATNVAGGRLSSSADLTLLTPVAGTYEQAVVTAGPVAYWRFGEKTGTTSFDYAGAHDSQIVNNVTLGGPGPASPAFPGFEAGNTAYAFDGADAYTETSSLGLPGPISVAAWVKPNALSGDRAIVGENASWAFKLLNDELRFTTPGILDHNSSGAALTAGDWQHVAVTFAPGTAGGAKFYVNGQFVSSADASSLTKGSSFVWIGKNQWAGQVFDGSIDEVAVYDKVLSDATIATMYAQAVSVSVRVTIERTASGVILSWATGKLESNADLSKPAGWTAVPGATPPKFTVPVVTGTQFYRVRVE